MLECNEKTTIRTLVVTAVLWIPLDAQAGFVRRGAREAYDVHSAVHSNDTPQFVTAFSHVVRAPQSQWVRLQIAAYNLGQASYITVTSLADKDMQRHDAHTLPEWRNRTAFFNGDAVRLELHVAPGEHGIFVRIGHMSTGRWLALDDQEDICGSSDNRVDSDDARVGRMAWECDGCDEPYEPVCTAWLIMNDALLTAGHCIDNNADGSADDDFVDGVIEFDVPPSSSDGTPVLASSSNQYPVSSSSLTFNNGGTGDDWGVFFCGRNSNTMLTAHEAQCKVFHLTKSVPSTGTTLRVSGYGIDDGQDNQTLQTATGPFVTLSGTALEHEVDTDNANSGSPIVWENLDIAIGIHTNGGCPGGNNAGTSFLNADLCAALDGITGFVDVVCTSP